MKILYAVQGTGNGHISRARDIIPALQHYGEVDVLISGIQADVSLPVKPTYQLHGMSFMFGKKGGVDIWQTFRKCVKKKFINEVSGLPARAYDLIVNDFEPVSAWAAQIQKVPCISLSHQWAVLSPGAPVPESFDPLGKFILRNYAPCKQGVGFHFKNYNDTTFLPVIRRQVREMSLSNQGHFTVYLPAYDDKSILKVLKQIPSVDWQVFSKHTKKAWKEKNVRIEPIQNDAFIQSMVASEGVLCGAGFETPAEALFGGKKLLVIPMKGQFEQQCNAAALIDLGVPAIKSLKKKHVEKIAEWALKSTPMHIPFEDSTHASVAKVIQKYHQLIGEQNPIRLPYLRLANAAQV